MKGVIKFVLNKVGLDIVRLPLPYTVDKHLQDLLPALGVDAVFDVGANRGQFARRLRELGYRGWILSFEPNAALIDHLELSSRSDPRWLVFPIALGDTNGILDINVSRNDDLTSALVVSKYAREVFGNSFDVAHTESVEMSKLDDMFDHLKYKYDFYRPFLKMDTQGYDLHVFRGAERVRSEFVGLMTEMSLRPLYDGMPDVTESLDSIRQAGFDVTGIFPVSTDPHRALVEVDCVARRRG